MKQSLWFVGGMLVGLTALSVSKASVPKRITDDTALYQNLSEIRVRRHAELKTEHEVSRLAALESNFREDLPVARSRKGVRAAKPRLRDHVRLRNVVERVSKRKYLP